MSRLRLVRTGENEYRIERLDRDILQDVAKVLKNYVIMASKKGYRGYTFDHLLDLVTKKNLRRMHIKKVQLEINRHDS